MAATQPLPWFLGTLKCVIRKKSMGESQHGEPVFGWLKVEQMETHFDKENPDSSAPHHAGKTSPNAFLKATISVLLCNIIFTSLGTQALCCIRFFLLRPFPCRRPAISNPSFSRMSKMTSHSRLQPTLRTADRRTVAPVSICGCQVSSPGMPWTSGRRSSRTAQQGQCCLDPRQDNRKNTSTLEL